MKVDLGTKSLFIILIIFFLICLSIILIFERQDQNISYIEKELEKIIPTTKLGNEDNLPKITNISEAFSSIENNIELEASEELITIISTGDIMLGRTVNYKTLTYKDFTWAFKNIGDLLKTGDVTFINLENPLVANCPTKNEGMIFCAPNDHVKGLLFAGVDVASLANNHAYNYAAPGLNNTETVLTENNILVAGKTNPVYKEVVGANNAPKEIKVAFLAYDDVECYPNSIACLDENKLKEDITLARQNADLVIIMFHWGLEYTHTPTNRQKTFAHLSIDSGADLVLGNHPHWIQPLEIYKEKLIAYSHGNTIFDQMWSEKTKEGIIMKTTFNKKTHELVDIKIYPTYIEDYGQPKFSENSTKTKVIELLKNISN